MGKKAPSAASGKGVGWTPMLSNLDYVFSKITNLRHILI